ncbi:DUF2332 domain-containing protein [Nocardioides mesophilus]|uniref:DUF2332 domain-containing protein n=1 Tax=Nocardioides mesophilus TaxID=433659 RepID=A0A7G9R823_9ACTN|nr:DUF2332 domain-containing protein [Nocardioides mesophilus]QNN51748.1 DUF2332 domain-containing protein [Nocardioides mesophilus]
MRIVEAFRRQAEACSNLGSPMYAELLDRLVADLEAGGPSATVLAGHEHDPGPSALGLRLLGSVHRLVLERRAGELATFYPSVGGTWEPEGGWVAFRDLLDRQPDAVREWLDRPPQTNEVGRAAALVGGLLHLEDPFRLPVRLFEIGASGGLNLLADRFAYVDESGAVHGDPASPVLLENAWRGRALRPWPALGFVERAGCDVMPVDPRTTEGRTTLTAYVWPDQTARFERLRGALALAAEHPYEVRRQSAVDLVAGLELRPGTTTVLWHSVMWQYLSSPEQDAVSDRVAALGAQATDEAPFVHLFLEPTRRTPDSAHDFLVVLQTWPTGEQRFLGDSVGHGLPTTWD